MEAISAKLKTSVADISEVLKTEEGDDSTLISDDADVTRLAGDCRLVVRLADP